MYVKKQYMMILLILNITLFFVVDFKRPSVRNMETRI
jgi:hypothetical protein